MAPAKKAVAKKAPAKKAAVKKAPPAGRGTAKRAPDEDDVPKGLGTKGVSRKGKR